MAKVFAVGLGPGGRKDMTVRASEVLENCDVIAGYSVYIDLVKDEYRDKEFFSTGMTKEVERCEAALEMAEGGKNVAVICSGDPGIYGMAALLFELRGDRDIEIEIVPGVTAASGGAALLGAPLNHDFAVISLSDRLTPWEKIEKRLKAAAEADFVIAIYNPNSKGRPGYLARACDILLEIIPEARVCGIARNIGREGESFSVMTLKELKTAECDMFCTVFIGNSTTLDSEGRMISPTGYRHD